MDGKERLRKCVPDGNGIGCFMCKMILDDLELHGKLTDWPPMVNLGSEKYFPAGSKVAHLEVEGLLGGIDRESLFGVERD